MVREDYFFRKKLIMTENEKQQLEFEKKILLEVLDFHSQNKLGRSDSEYESYINDILDEINKINKKLGSIK